MLFRSFAAIHSMPEVISVLIEAGADVNAKDKDGITPLMWAAWYNDIPEVISVLIKAGAKVNARVPLFKDSVDVPESTKEKEGWSPLMFAASNNRNPEVISVLIKAGAEVNARDKTGRKAIDYAKSNFHLKDTDVYRQLHDASFE